ncbi:MAG: DUF2279 domain-containing protein [Myxococcales bacterium]|nr:DUF2279 domain-containing protein [Myxococcales bacterium]
MRFDVATLVALVAVTAAPAARADCTLARADAPCLTPWLDQGAPMPWRAPTPPPDHRWRAAAVVGGLYVGFSAWAYVAWYRDVESLDEFGVGGDGWFGRNTYAGGADKLGHAWATYTLGRATTGVLRCWAASAASRPRSPAPRCRGACSSRSRSRTASTTSSRPETSRSTASAPAWPRRWCLCPRSIAGSTSGSSTSRATSTWGCGAGSTTGPRRATA